MKLYFSGISKYNITYTPDCLMFTTKDGKQYTYDIQGDIDYSEGGLSGKCKGDLVLWAIDESSIEDLHPDWDDRKKTEEGLPFLKGLREAKEIIISIYPDDDTISKEKLDKDELTNCSAILDYVDENDQFQEIEFDFVTEFYGI